MSTRVALVLLIVLAVLFFVGIGVGAGQEDDFSSADFGAWRARIGRFERLIPRGVVDAAAVRRAEPGSCFADAAAQLTAAPGDACRLTLEPARGARDLFVRLVGGDSAEAVLVQPANDEGEPITARSDLRPNRTETLAVFRRRSDADTLTFTVICDALSESNCVVRLEEEAR